MKIPQEVKIMGVPYTVEMVDEVIMYKKEERIGQIEYSKQLIQIYTEQAKESLELTFLHEIVHGLMHGLGLAQNESIVDRLALGLWQLFNDNPDMFNEQESAPVITLFGDDGEIVLEGEKHEDAV